jgi:hypothetical protein
VDGCRSRFAVREGRRELCDDFRNVHRSRPGRADLFAAGVPAIEVAEFAGGFDEVGVPVAAGLGCRRRAGLASKGASGPDLKLSDQQLARLRDLLYGLEGDDQLWTEPTGFLSGSEYVNGDFRDTTLPGDTCYVPRPANTR